MNPNWKEYSIDELKSLDKNAIAMGPFGSNIKTSNFVECGVPVIRGGNLNAYKLLEKDYVYLTEEKADELKASNAKRGDIVITHRGTLGQVGIIPEDSKYQRYVVSQSQMKVSVDKTKVIPEFIFYFLKSSIGQRELLRNVSQVGVPAIASPTTSVKSIKFFLPNIETQIKIIQKLEQLTKKIELNNQINETLEAMAKAIFKEWFIDFGPVKAKAAGKKPFGMDDETAALFPNSFEDSEFSLIPKGWKIKTFEDISNCYDSKRIPLSGSEREKRKGIYPYYGAASVMGYIDDFLFDGIYVLMGEDGSVVNEAGSPVLQYVWNKFWVNNHAHILTGKDISTEHLLLFLKHIIITPYITGAVQPKLNQGNMNRIPFVFATEEINLAFTKIIKPLFNKIRSNEEENRLLVQTRDLLLPKLISGEIELRGSNG